MINRPNRAVGILACLLLCTACGARTSLDLHEASEELPPVPRAHHERFVGWWAVEQPTHALYEVTYYLFEEDGTLSEGSSLPPDCGTHLERHCVTGSVGRCESRMAECEPTCVFGDAWYSLDASTLVIAGRCSDDISREIRLSFSEDASRNASGAPVEVVSVGQETGWVHDNWDWYFRRCPPGSDDATCN